MPAHSRAATPSATPWPKAVFIACALSIAVGIVLLAFSWPAITANPKDVPVGIVGADDKVDTLVDAVEDSSDGALEFARFDDRDAAVTAIERREVFGAIVLGSQPTDPPEVLTAPAASTQVAQMLSGVTHHLQAQIDAQIRMAVEAKVNAQLSGQAPPPAANETPQPFEIPEATVTTTEVVPLSDDDPKGAGLSASMFPLVIGGIFGGVTISMLLKGSGLKRVVALLVYAAAAGFVLTGILQGLYGALQGDYALNSAALALSIAAISATLTGLAGVLGAAGAGIGAAFMMLVANPISGAMAPAAFIAQPWGELGQWLPPGAAGTLIRNLSYFPEVHAVSQWVLLGIWAFVGLALTALNLPGRVSKAQAVDEPQNNAQRAPAHAGTVAQ